MQSVSSATAQGGIGGFGFDNAKAGVGGAALLVDVVSGHSNGGALTLDQDASGGLGGSTNRTSNGGFVGAATSTLHFDDTLKAVHSALVTTNVTATGGAAEAVQRISSDVLAGNGGAATAFADITATAVSLDVTATGGRPGTAFVGGLAGSATATAIGHAGGQVDVHVTASGGLGTASSGLATVAASSLTGTIHATASATTVPGVLVGHVDADASSTLKGAVAALDSGADVARAGLGLAIAPMDTTSQSVALITGAPVAADVAGVLAANAAIKAAFTTPSQSFFAIGELGGRYSVAGHGSELAPVRHRG